MAAINEQIGGGHYKKMVIQPAEYCHKNGLGYLESAVIKYVSRWRSKNGLEDLQKAIHCIQLLIDFEYGMIEESHEEESHKHVPVQLDLPFSSIPPCADRCARQFYEYTIALQGRSGGKVLC